MLKTKVKNLFKFKNYDINLDNININGRRVGCSGFITNPENGLTVYLNTERSCYGPISDKNLVRYARSTKDYTGGFNEFVNDDNLLRKVVAMLEKPDLRTIPWKVQL